MFPCSSDQTRTCDGTLELQCEPIVGINALIHHFAVHFPIMHLSPRARCVCARVRVCSCGVCVPLRGGRWRPSGYWLGLSFVLSDWRETCDSQTWLGSARTQTCARIENRRAWIRSCREKKKASAPTCTLDRPASTCASVQNAPRRVHAHTHTPLGVPPDTLNLSQLKPRGARLLSGELGCSQPSRVWANQKRQWQTAWNDIFFFTSACFTVGTGLGRGSRFAAPEFDLAGEKEMVLNKPSRDGGSPSQEAAFALLAHVYTQRLPVIQHFSPLIINFTISGRKNVFNTAAGGLDLALAVS